MKWRECSLYVYVYLLSLCTHGLMHALSHIHTPHTYKYINRTVVYIFSCFCHSLRIINQHYMVCASFEIKINTFKIGFPILSFFFMMKRILCSVEILVNFILHAVAQCVDTKRCVSPKQRTQEEILRCLFFIKKGFGLLLFWSMSALIYHKEQSPRFSEVFGSNQAQPSYFDHQCDKTCWVCNYKTQLQYYKDYCISASCQEAKLGNSCIQIPFC